MQLTLIIKGARDFVVRVGAVFHIEEVRKG